MAFISDITDITKNSGGDKLTFEDSLIVALFEELYKGSLKIKCRSNLAFL